MNGPTHRMMISIWPKDNPLKCTSTTELVSAKEPHKTVVDATKNIATDIFVENSVQWMICDDRIVCSGEMKRDTGIIGVIRLYDLDDERFPLSWPRTERERDAFSPLEPPFWSEKPRV